MLDNQLGGFVGKLCGDMTNCIFREDDWSNYGYNLSFEEATLLIKVVLPLVEKPIEFQTYDQLFALILREEPLSTSKAGVIARILLGALMDDADADEEQDIG